MKPMIMGMVAALVIAVAAGVIMQSIDSSSAAKYSTSSTRL